MMESLNMSDAAAPRGSVEHRIEKLGRFRGVGLARKQSLSKMEAIPGQWQTFMEMYDQVSNKAEPIPLSVTTDMDADGNFTYLTGVQVFLVDSVPKGLVSQTVPAQTYAAIWDRWVPESGKVVSNGPWLEKHLPSFNPRTGLGGVAIWILIV